MPVNRRQARTAVIFLLFAKSFKAAFLHLLRVYFLQYCNVNAPLLWKRRSTRNNTRTNSFHSRSSLKLPSQILEKVLHPCRHSSLRVRKRGICQYENDTFSFFKYFLMKPCTSIYGCSEAIRGLTNVLELSSRCFGNQRLNTPCCCVLFV